jgi:hypothetical protein
MRALSTAALLDAWEHGVGQSLLQRALTLLAAACPDTPPEQLARLPMGQRDSRLLRLRELTFGPRLNAVVQCPRCLAQLELAFDAADTRAAASVEGDIGTVSLRNAEREGGSEPEILTAAFEHGEVRYRLPNTLDLAAVAFERNVSHARRLLLERCVLAIMHDGAASTVENAPPDLLDATVRHMSQADPQGDVQVTFSCPSCGHGGESAFDIASFFWSEVDVWASRTLSDVHTLANAYGWREADILAMSPERRRQYIDRVG